MKTIATINFKGGVGKTTVTWCLGDVLSKGSPMILLFDLDAQASLTQSIEFGAKGLEFKKWKEESEDAEKTTYDALHQFLNSDGEFKFEPDDSFIYKLTEKYHFVPATDNLYWTGLDSLDPEKGRVFIRRLLEKIGNSSLFPNYDYVIFDCPPSFTPLSYSVLTCCDLVLVPVNPDFFASKGVDLLVNGLYKRITPRPFPKIAVFANKVRGRRYWDGPSKIVPFFRDTSRMRDITKSCDYARQELGIDIQFLNAWLPSRATISRAITDRSTPPEFLEYFEDLWKEVEALLK